MSTGLIQRLQAVRRKHGAVAAALSAVAAVGLFAACVVGGMLLDRQLDLSYRLRVGLMAVYAAVIGFAVVRLGLMPLFKPPSLEVAARWVERSSPLFRDRLISAVHFHNFTPDPADASPALVKQMVRQAESLAESVRFTDVIRTGRLRRWSAVVAVWVAVVGGTIALAGPAAAALARRALLVPGVPFPRRTTITNLTGPIRLARGDAVALSASASGQIPATGFVRLTYADGATADLPLVPTGARFDRPIANVQTSFTYSFFLGDNQSDPAPVTVVVRPAVVDVRCEEVLPAYTVRPPVARSTADLSLLKGSRLTVQVKSTTPGRASAGTSKCAIHFAGSDVDFPLVGSVNDLKQMHVTDGGRADVPVPPGTTGMSITLVDDDGVKSADGVLYRIDLHDDAPPKVKLLTPAEPQTTATPIAKVAVSVDADDDFAVARMSLKYRITRAGSTTAQQADPHGLTASYFPTSAFDGTPIDRPEPAIDATWATTPPPPGTAVPCGVRWTGFVRAVYSEPVTLIGDFTDGVKIWVDDQLILTRDRPGQQDALAVPMIAGRAYTVRVETPLRSITGTAKLMWRSRRLPTAVIPHDRWLRRRPADPLPDADALIGLWTLDDPTPGFAHDSVGGATGTVINGTRGPGRLGQGIVFDRIDEAVVIPSTPAMQFAAADSFTLQAWVRTSAGQNRLRGIVAKGRDGGNWYGLWIDPSDRFAAMGSAGSLFGPAVSDGWHLVAVVQDGKKRALVVDGIAAASSAAAAADNGNELVFGNVRGAAGQTTGALPPMTVDEVRLYGRALSAQELKRQFDDPEPPILSEAATTDAADTLPVDIGPPAPSVHQDISFDLAKLPTPAGVGDSIEFWIEATDANDVTGPGVGSSEHRTIKVISAADKQKELMGKLGDYLGEVRSVSESQKDLKDKVDTIVGPKR